MYDYRVYYDTQYTRDCSRPAFKERPEGLIRAHLARRFRTTVSGTLVVPVIAICERDGKTIREEHLVHITAATAKKHSPRLRRVRISESTA